VQLSDPLTAGAFVFQVFKTLAGATGPASATSISCTVFAPTGPVSPENISCSDTSNTVLFAAGDLVSVRATPTGSPTPDITNLGWSLTFTP
jgi:hypothetical protein